MSHVVHPKYGDAQVASVVSRSYPVPPTFPGARLGDEAAAMVEPPALEERFDLAWCVGIMTREAVARGGVSPNLQTGEGLLGGLPCQPNSFRRRPSLIWPRAPIRR